jgi:hypothetical protein
MEQVAFGAKVAEDMPSRNQMNLAAIWGIKPSIIKDICDFRISFLRPLI